MHATHPITALPLSLPLQVSKNLSALAGLLQIAPQHSTSLCATTVHCSQQLRQTFTERVVRTHHGHHIQRSVGHSTTRRATSPKTYNYTTILCYSSGCSTNNDTHIQRASCSHQFSPTRRVSSEVVCFRMRCTTSLGASLESTASMCSAKCSTWLVCHVTIQQNGCYPLQQVPQTIINAQT